MTKYRRFETEIRSRAGCAAMRKTRQGAVVGLYRAQEAAIDSDPELPWATICEDHGSLLCHRTRRDAEALMSQPDEWCDDCRAETEKRHVEIRWSEVEAAMRRSIRGQASDNDRALCDRAWRSDCTRYRALHQRVRAEVNAEEIARWQF